MLIDTTNKLVVVKDQHQLFFKECLESDMWIENVSMQTKVPVEKIEIALKDFNSHLIASGEEHKHLRDYKSHFASWVRKVKQVSR